MNAPGEIRTPDLRFRRPTLYPAELRAHVAETPMFDGREPAPTVLRADPSYLPFYAQTRASQRCLRPRLRSREAARLMLAAELARRSAHEGARAGTRLGYRARSRGERRCVLCRCPSSSPMPTGPGSARWRVTTNGHSVMFATRGPDADVPAGHAGRAARAVVDQAVTAMWVRSRRPRPCSRRSRSREAPTRPTAAGRRPPPGATGRRGRTCVRVLQRLDRTVLGPGARGQAIADDRDPLVVTRADGRARAADGSDATVRRDVHRMQVKAAGLRPVTVVPDGVRQILLERAAVCDVEQLHAPAHAEDRQVNCQGR